MTSSRLTRVQQDVIDRLNDGWTLRYAWPSFYVLCKDGEPSRHVAMVTGDALVRREIVKLGERRGELVLA